FGYSLEDLRLLLPPMAAAEEAIGSMGDDTALACLSDRPRLLYDYFKQRFAQVTNPAIDPLRERLVVSLVARLGARGNLLEETPEHARLLELEQPILLPDDLERIRSAHLERPWLRSQTLGMRFAVDAGGLGLDGALAELCRD